MWHAAHTSHPGLAASASLWHTLESQCASHGSSCCSLMTASVGGSVGGAVGGSVGGAVGGSVGGAVGGSVGGAVGGAVVASVVRSKQIVNPWNVVLPSLTHSIVSPATTVTPLGAFLPSYVVPPIVRKSHPCSVWKPNH